MKRVVVTGLGLLTSIGNNKEETWSNLINLKSGIKKISHLDMEILLPHMQTSHPSLHYGVCLYPVLLLKYFSYQ